VCSSDLNVPSSGGSAPVVAFVAGLLAAFPQTTSRRHPDSGGFPTGGLIMIRNFVAGVAVVGLPLSACPPRPKTCT